MGTLIKALSLLLAGAGVIWLNIESVGIAAFWAADNFGRSDDLQIINMQLQAFYEQLLENDQSALIVQYGPWGLTIGGSFLFVMVIIWRYLRRLFKQDHPGKLAQACENLAEEITQFINERRSQEPQSLPVDLNEVTDEVLDNHLAEEAIYSSKTKVLYEERITPKLNSLHSLLIENEHRPNEMLIFGDDSWANRKIGKLKSYARTIRLGETIVDERQDQGSV